MQLYEMQVAKTAIYRTAPVRIPKGIVGAAVKLSFSAEWEGLTKTVIFRAGEVTKDVLNVKDAAVIPAECTQEAGALLEIGVYGVDGENTVAIPTLWAAIGRVSEAADPSGDVTTDPQLPVYAQLQAQIDQLERQGITQNEIDQAIRDFFGGERPVGRTTPEGGEIFNFYTDPVETGDGKVFPGNTARKGAHAEGFSTQAYGEYSHAEGWGSKTGKADGTGQDADIPGGIAHAEGRETEALGYCSHAEGRDTKATGGYSHAEGNGSMAAGENSHAEGSGSTASGKASHAEGTNSSATGENSHAEGYGSKAAGKRSHAEGTNSSATGDNAHAEGSGSTASGIAAHAQNSNNTASGNHASASGLGCNAIGNVTDAGGSGTKAIGEYSFTRGYQTEASGAISAAFGRGAKAKGYCAFAEGRDTVAAGQHQHVQGKWNVPDAGKAHIVGGGSSDTDRKNIYTLDWQGNAEFAGKVYSGGVELAPVGLVYSAIRIASGTDADLMAEIDGIYAQMADNTVRYISVSFGEKHPTLGGTAYLFEIFRRTEEYGFLKADSYVGFSARRILNADWWEWEWINPPLLAGVEYRTVNRYAGKPIYVKYVSYTGAITVSSTWTFFRIPHKIENFGMLDRLDARVGGGIVFPLLKANNETISIESVNSENIEIRFKNSGGLAEGKFRFALHYTKSTD